MNEQSAHHRQEILQQPRDLRPAQGGEQLCHQAEHAKGSELDQQRDQRHQRFVHIIENTGQPPTGLPRPAQGQAEQKGKQYDLQHPAFSHCANRVGRDDGNQRVLDAGGFGRLEVGLQGSRRDAGSRLNDGRKQEGDGDGQRGGEQIKGDGLSGHPADAVRRRQAGRAAYQRHEHQGYHHELKAANEYLPARVNQAADQVRVDPV